MKKMSALLATGFGDSITFQILSSVKKYFDRSSLSPLVIVISLSNSIIKDQVKYLRSLYLKAAFVCESAKIIKTMEGTAQMDFLHGSPMPFVRDDKSCVMFSNVFFKN